MRKLDQDHYSNTFLVEDLQFSQPNLKYLGAKILSADATKVNGAHELKILSRLSEGKSDYCEALLPVLRDRFVQESLYGFHYCFLSRPFAIDVNAFRASAPSGRLSVHLVKPIVVRTLQALHIKASNLPFSDLGSRQIEKTIAEDPPSYSDVYTFNGTEYPILETQPLQSVLSWDASAFYAETVQVILSGLGAALCADFDEPNLSGNIGTFALRAPEVIIRAQCGKEIDIWLLGTYELLTEQTLFRPLAIPSLTPNESLLLLQFAVTGETLSKDVIDRSRVRDKFFDRKELCKDDLTEIQINAAAKFINDCLRLNPHDRPTVDRLVLHPWLSTAFTGDMDDCGSIFTIDELSIGGLSVD
ncbi:hypothetical protein Clacol_009177 [Clathrus columnatus]|uniref:non-specific serine/threonine protein kinase n=1 Tax=Clathrus columnatus TaxID=1419009 RepID=A0AAV5AMF9_9AGAM|nr:hypothetical protein Clacol_009177 [Clathrus columnatus]